MLTWLFARIRPHAKPEMSTRTLVRMLNLYPEESEWYMPILGVLWALCIVVQPGMFSTFVAYSDMNAIGSEMAWAIAMVAVSAIHGFGIWIWRQFFNPSIYRRKTWVRKALPLAKWCRCTGVMLAGMFWMFVSVGMAISSIPLGFITTGTLTYGVISWLCFALSWRLWTS